HSSNKRPSGKRSAPQSIFDWGADRRVLVVRCMSRPCRPTPAYRGRHDCYPTACIPRQHPARQRFRGTRAPSATGGASPAGVRTRHGSRREARTACGPGGAFAAGGHLGLEALLAAGEVTQLALQICLQAGAVFALELLELLNVLLQRGAL